MRDDDDGMTEISHAVQHFSLGLGVEGRCAYIEQKHGGVGADRTRNGKALVQVPIPVVVVSSQVRSIWHHLPSIFTAFQVWPLPAMRPLAMPAALRSLE